MQTSVNVFSSNVRLSGRYPAALAVITFAFVLVAQILWLHWNRAPMLWDDSMYAAGALDLYDGLEANGLLGLGERFVHGPAGAKAPLISLLPLPFFVVFGRGSDWAFYTVELLAFAIICLAAYRLVWRLSNSFGAFVAVALLCFMPLLVGLTRQFLVEVPLLAVVLLWHERLLLSEFLERPGEETRLGIILGLGMLLKVSFPLFVLGSLIAGIGLHVVRRRARKQAFWEWKELAILVIGGVTAVAATAGLGGMRGYATVGVPIAVGLFTRRFWSRRVAPGTDRCFVILGVGYLIAAFWYSPNLLPLLQFAWGTSFGAMALAYDQPLTTYIAQICSFGFSNLQLVLLATGVMAVFLSKNRLEWSSRGDEDQSQKTASTWTIFLWLVLPLAVFLISHDRIVRLTLPCLAALPIAGGLLGAELRNRSLKLAAVWAGACLVFGSALFVSFSFGLGPFDRAVVGPWVFWGKQLDWDQTPPSAIDWPHSRIVRVTSDILGNRNNRSVFLLINQPQLNWLNLKLAALQERVTLDFDFAGRFPQVEPAAEAAKTVSLLLVKEGGQRGPEWTEETGRALTAVLKSGGLGPFVLAYELPLPDEGSLHFYERVDERAAIADALLPKSHVVFGDQITLVGLDLRLEKEALRWRAGWTVERHLDKDYSVYLHFVDSAGGLFPKDHAILVNGEGTRGMQRGETFSEEYVIPLTPDIRNLRILRVGVYESATLTKLPVTQSTMPVVERRDGILINVPEPSDRSER